MPLTNYDHADPINVLQLSIEDAWDSDLPNVYYTGKFSDPASSSTAPDDAVDYCVLDFGDATKEARTNISVIWSVPVTVKVFDLSESKLRPRVTELREFLGSAERALSASVIDVTGGNLSSVIVGRVSYEKSQATKAKAEFEIVYRLVLPVLLGG
jgi:hypothetical protein